MDRNQAEPGRHSRVGKRFQRRALVGAQRIRHADQNADHTVLARRSPHRAIVAVDDHLLTVLSVVLLATVAARTDM